MGNVLLDEIEKRKRNIDEYKVKIETKEALKAEISEKEEELAKLENEIANINTDILQSEIDYLTGVAIREGIIQPDEAACPVDNETAPTVETETV